MFLHILKYELKNGLRTKDLIIWLILFPIILGLCFKIAFGSIYEKTEKFESIPVAVVEDTENPAFRQVLEGIESADEPFLKVSFVNKEKAEKLLDDGDVEGIIFSADKLSLTVKEKGLRETMLKSFVEQYTVREKIAMDAVKTSPEKAQEVISALTEETASSCREIPLTQGNPDMYIQYFYNLIAMVAMYGCITGMHITMQNQANLSALGARNNCSPTPKLINILACLTGSFILQAICMLICISFLAFVLKVDFGDRLPLVYPTAFLGGIMGVSFGFFVGSINRMSEKVKTAVLMSITMFLCFCSGLMVGNMKAVIAEKLPWFNNINPAALIADSFYCLNIYEDYDRFITKLISMAVISVVFIILGFITSRRKKYASV
ncbi:ABC transporter permease [Ruminococcus flavefaciens]|uniref:ABC transporter permease n=1 Tax=Ruminococcus flavefaciens TaxID=1265 RepID=UPI0026F1EDC8|nr:ABC transporter permease [Ruminococcus flavefaciens]MDD7515841.1 ABC transporter permease [Ruminococcus flavefaciens]MDY5691922.1 ABC transporter permease [Ruminococcus flavefaciens]